MLDTRTNSWLSRLQANGPKLVSFVFGALILLQLLQIALPLISKPLQVPEPVVAAAAPRPQRSGVDIQSVVAAHLFGVPPAATQDEGNAPQSSANLLLAGTIATQDPRHGVAIISEGGAPSKVYSVGDTRRRRIPAFGLHGSRHSGPRRRARDSVVAASIASLPRGARGRPACSRRRPTHRGCGREHSAHGAAGPRYSGSGDAHGGLI